MATGEIRLPSVLFEIAERESPEARQSWLDRSMESGDLGPLPTSLGLPHRASNVRRIDGPDDGSTFGDQVMGYLVQGFRSGPFLGWPHLEP